MTLIYIAIAFIFGIILGKYSFSGPTTKFSKSEGSSPEVMNELREEAHEAIQARTNKRKAKILALAGKQGRITNDDVEDMFCISDSTARRYLNELEEEGKLNQIGTTGRGVHYTPNS